MTSKHLLWWVFNWLTNYHPSVMASMLADLKGDERDPWVNTALHERYNARR